MFVLDARPGHVTALAFAPGADRLYASHGLNRAHVWNLADRTAEPLRVAALPRTSSLLRLHPDGRWAFALAQSERGQPFLPHLFDLASGAAWPFNFAVYTPGGVAVSPDGGRLVSVGNSMYEPVPPGSRPAPHCYRLYAWAVTDGGPERLWHQDVAHNVTAGAVVALCGDRFATAERVAVTAPTVHQWRVQVAVRSTADGAALAALDFPHPFLQQLLASPDGTKLVARCGTELRVWDATNWGLQPRVTEGRYKAEMDPPAACFTPSGDYLLLANGATSVLAYDTRTWQVVRKWNWRGGALRVAAVSPDGTLAAGGGPRGDVVVWDLDL